MTLDRDFFNQQIRDFLKYRNSLLDKNYPIILTIQTVNFYYEDLKNIPQKRFFKVIQYLYHNWKFNTFPLLADFHEAISNTEHCDEYNATTFKQSQEEKKLCEEKLAKIQASFKIRTKIRADVQRTNKASPDDVDDLYKTFIKTKLRANEFYDPITRTWHKIWKEGLYDPRDSYPPSYWN